MRKMLVTFVVVLAAAMVLAQEAAPAYTGSLNVKTPPKTDTKFQKSESKDGKGASTKSSIVTMTWPVRVAFSGKEMPKAVSLKSYFIGMRDDELSILGESSTEVTLDPANHSFKGEVASPPATLVKTEKRTGGRRGRTVTEKSGERITGCIIQLVADGKVVRSFVSNSKWKKLAQADTLDTEAVLKLR